MGGNDNLDDEMAEFSKSIENLARTIREKMPEFLRLGGLIIKAIGTGLMESIKEFLPQIAGTLLLIPQRSLHLQVLF
jgi:hypothetical protein